MCGPETKSHLDLGPNGTHRMGACELGCACVRVSWGVCVRVSWGVPVVGV